MTNKEWTEKVTGYYINVAPGSNYNAVRPSYFTTLPKQFMKKNELPYV